MPGGGKQQDEKCLENELTLGDGLRGDCSMVCFLEGVPSSPPFWQLVSMVVDCCLLWWARMVGRLKVDGWEGWGLGS